MTRLPSSIVVHLKREPPDGGQLDNVLVTLELNAGGRYYFGTLIGLTDDTGTAVITSEGILRDFEHSRRMFLMDYKVPLENIDPVAGISVDGGPAFRELKHTAEQLSYVSSSAKAAYAQAKNASLESTRTEVQLDPESGESLEIELTVRALREP